MAIYLVLLALLVFLVLLPLGHQWLGVNERNLSDAQWPLGSWAHRTDVQHAVKLPTAEVPLVLVL